MDDFKFNDDLDRDTNEYKIHVAISDYLNGRSRKGNQVIEGIQPFPGMLVTHAYQGRSKEEGFFLKALGVKPGIADLLCFYRGVTQPYEVSFLEVKKPGGVQSSPQRKIMGHCHALGIPYAIVKSVKDAHEHFKSRGLKPVHNAIREPDTRTDSQKKQDVFDMYRP